MNTDRIKEIQQETAYPDSVSVQQALLKVWNETEQERIKDSDKAFEELVYWCNKHGVSFGSPGELKSECPTLNMILNNRL